MGRFDKLKVYKNITDGFVVPTSISIKAFDFKIRYVKIWQDGSTANLGNHLCGVIVWDKNNNIISTGKTLTAEPSGKTVVNGSNALLTTITSTYASITPEDGIRCAFVLDLGDEYEVNKIQVARYYPDGRTYFGTAIEVYNVDKSLSATLHEAPRLPLYAETINGFVYDKWISLGNNTLNDWNKDIKIKTSDGWIKKSLDFKNKRVKCNRSGARMYLSDGSWFYNYNTGSAAPNAYYRFYCRVMKDVTGSARSIYEMRSASSGTIYGLNITWEADGRISFNQGSSANGYGTKYYSSNAVNVSGKYIDLEITCYGSASNFQIRWNGVTTKFTSSPQASTVGHYYAYIGTWGLYFEGNIRMAGYKSSSGAKDVIFNLNNFTPATNSSQSFAVSGVTIYTNVCDIDNYQYL